MYFNDIWTKLLRNDLYFIRVPKIPKRVLIVMISALANCLSYVYRTNMSVTIVAMVNHTHLHPAQNSDDNNPCVGPLKIEPNPETLNGPFIWDETVQGHILGSYYYGYIFTNLQGGFFSNKFGPRLLCSIAILVPSILTIISPFVAEFNVIAFIFLRVINGLCQGVLTPSLYSLLSVWIPRNERALALSLIQVGGNIGAILTTILSGILCSTLGWKSVFYISGIFGIFCFIVWILTVYNTPSEHPSISKTELYKIKLNVNVTEIGTELKNKPKIPWRQILFSLPVWAISIAKFCGAWGNLMLMSKLPAYLKTVLHVSITQNGYITSLVYVALSLSLTIFGIISDKIQQKNVLSMTNSRKLFECIALIGPALCLLFVPKFNCNIDFLILLLVLAMSIFGMNAGGEKPIVVDVAPDFSGTVYGITNAIGSLPGILAPLLVGFMTTHCSSIRVGWNLVFYSASGIYIFGALFFGIFAKANIQPWGIIDSNKINTKNISSNCKCSDLIIHKSCTQIAQTNHLNEPIDSVME